MKKFLIASCILILSSGFLSDTSAQGRGTKKNKKPAAVATPAPTPLPTPQPTVDEPAKRNGRPNGEVSSKGRKAVVPTHFYDFTRPGFTYPHILIEHDDAGKGTISFMKDGFDEMINDPIELTAATVSNINATLAALNFIDSTDVYQTERDHSNMGNMEFTLKQPGRQRTVKYNWSDNKNAKSLMDEYRRIANEYTWKFELSVARENQPLQTPSLLEVLDSYITRREISDPGHLLPLLNELTNDERLPLIARNHAAKLIKQIEKELKK